MPGWGRRGSGGKWGRATSFSPDLSREEKIALLKERIEAIKEELQWLDRRISQLTELGKTQPASFRVAVQQERCRGCGICEEVCPQGAIRVREVAVIDQERCIGCGICVEECPHGALYLKACL